ncbi:MAG: hypothetical protein CL910_02405 [Deltaproteobacteria bacterium]|jgi:hypothetical protein|nr:hypothetical protein [Deltaproteobacteria bacterium]
MALKSRVDNATGTYVIEGSGEVAGAEVVAACPSLGNPAARRQLWDLTETLSVNVAAAAVRSLAAKSPHFPGSRVAIAAAVDQVYGLARMLQELAAGEVGVFRNRADAAAWLVQG